MNPFSAFLTFPIEIIVLGAGAVGAALPIGIGGGFVSAGPITIGTVYTLRFQLLWEPEGNHE